jgi:hypothetical protein
MFQRLKKQLGDPIDSPVIMLGIRGESAKSLVFWGPKKIEPIELEFPVRWQVWLGSVSNLEFA